MRRVVPALSFPSDVEIGRVMDAFSSEMRERIAAFDWSATPVGPRDSWPSTLRTVIEAALSSQFPICVFWGPRFVQIYNDAYIPLFGKLHPHALGRIAEATWPDVWDRVGPMFASVIATGVPTGGEDVAFVLQRNGYDEEAYFTFSYSRLAEPGGESGILCINTETTKSVLRERDFRAMADAIDNIVFTHAADGTVEWANSRWYDYTQLSDVDAIVVDGWARVIPPADLERLLAAHERAFVEGEGYETEIRIKPATSGDAGYRWHLVRANPMRAADGTILRWAGSATDVHDNRTASEALRRELERERDREQQASLAFQNAALPVSLPMVPGLRFDAIYEAAGGNALVGGDWYDAFRLPDGRVVISVGDVIGSGLSAAVTMSAARQAIRGAAQVYPEPAAVLDAADRALRSEQPDRIVTAFLGILDPLTRALSYATAGHPPPFLRAADGTITELGGCDLPLGLRDDARSVAQTALVVLPEDSLLVLYTDGLTEATHDVLEGERLLREALGRRDVFASEHPAAAIRQAVLRETSDDVAILTIRVGAERPAVRRWAFRADDAERATSVRREFARVLASSGASREEAADAEVVFGELLGNVVRHTAGEAEAALDLSDVHPVLHVLDRGTGFRFYPRLPHDTLSESGRGLYITTRLARDVSVVPRPDGGSHARAVLTMRASAPGTTDADDAAARA